MSLRAIALLSVMLASLQTTDVRSAPNPFSQSAPNPISQDEGDRNEQALLKAFWPMIKTSAKAVRVYYRARCQKVDNYQIPFPKDIAEGGIAAMEERPGIFSIRIGNVPDELLRTKIPNLVLTPVQQYDAWSAIRAIEGTPEFTSAIRKLRLHRESRVSNQPVQMPMAGLPHLPSTMKNTTVDQALDAVAKTLGVVVVYGYCESPPTFDIDVTGIDGQGMNAVSR